MTTLSKAIYRLSAIPIKIPILLFTETEKTILKFMQKHKRSQIAKTILNKKYNAGEIAILDLKIYARAMIITQHDTGTKIDM